MFLYIYTYIYLYFLSGFSFTNILESQDAGKGVGHFINSSLPLPLASQALSHQPDDYCRELTSAHSQQPESNQEPFVSERKSLTTNITLITLNQPCILRFFKVRFFASLSYKYIKIWYFNGQYKANCLETRMLQSQYLWWSVSAKIQWLKASSQMFDMVLNTPLKLCKILKSI